MNKYIFDFIDNRTGLVLETWEKHCEHLTSHDFKNISHTLFMYAAISWKYAKLTTYVYKNENSCFCVECKTIDDGCSIISDIFVNTKFMYTKMIAC